MTKEKTAYGAKTLKPLTKAIMEYAEELPEETVIHAKALLHLGNRAAVDQALSRLVKLERLSRISRGFYVRLLDSRFGKYSAFPHLVAESLAHTIGESVLPNPSVTANILGLTTQNPIREIYITSGRSRWLTFGRLRVEMRHAPRWYFSVGDQVPGRVLRVAGWEGPRNAANILHRFKGKLSPSDLHKMAAARPKLPSWLAKEVSKLLAND